VPPVVDLSVTQAPSCIGAARRRLGYAVAASVVAHVAVFTGLIEDVPNRGAGPGPDSTRSLTVNLAAAVESPVAIAPLQSNPMRETLEAHAPPQSASRAQANPIAKAHSAARSRVPHETSSRALPPIEAERAYYEAHELDTFPRLSQPLGPARDGLARHRVRLELLIGADGVVRKVSVLHADSLDAPAAAAREMWMAARFDPARKAGHAVASRIQLEVDYELPGRAR